MLGMPPECTRRVLSLLFGPSLAYEMASPLFFEGMRHDLGLKFFLKVHPLQAPNLIFELFHPAHHGHIHAAVFSALPVKRCRTDAQFPANVGHRKTRLNKFDRIHDLTVDEL